MMRKKYYRIRVLWNEEHGGYSIEGKNNPFDRWRQLCWISENTRSREQVLKMADGYLQEQIIYEIP